ncbi:hypothetical protein THER5_1982 [Bifidobacterium thermacidophilum subsp. thermacidophilum]|uniref:Uncharacterized protein n=1 Tax=Bifidobacterium thermacidophilum subsp. thermacidophilum TaxID=79262 RepID=A0A087E2V7_9BIFI|nr:hypothetical protein THER5_1982 [Bifidobacterium thermacidophilum subsp. thermacidophilum]
MQRHPAVCLNPILLFAVLSQSRPGQSARIERRGCLGKRCHHTKSTWRNTGGGAGLGQPDCGSAGLSRTGAAALPAA